MTRAEVARLAALAERLGCTPRELLVAAAHGVDAQGMAPSALLARMRTRVDAGDARMQACADLLLTPPGSYATDELDNLLGSIWRTGDP